MHGLKRRSRLYPRTTRTWKFSAKAECDVGSGFYAHLHKYTIEKKGHRKLNQSPYIVKGFRLYDRVNAKGKEWYISGRGQKGSFVLKTLADDKLKLEIAPSKIKFVSHQHSYVSERRAV